MTTSLQQAQAAATAHEETIASLKTELEAQNAKLQAALAKPDVSPAHTAALAAIQQDLDSERAAHVETSKGTEHKAALAALQKQLDEEKAAHEKTKEKAKVAAGPPVKGELKKLREEIEAEKTKRAENEKEQEDLLVLLEELSQKRKKDKERMKAADLEVSDAEDEGDDDEEE